MTIKTLASAALFAALGLGAITAQASSTSLNEASVMQYRYGDKLDVKKVLSLKDDRSNTCGVVNTRMDYLDSQGKPQSVEYRSYATSGCHDN
ncbi:MULTISPECIES: DUF2790 domain-containing protein [unclassified Pseudomonas]|uniref:DUF2790 domain-containing protein n=1 Tax=unclassified Pseudomonas TaxID=196821 RepID=UPI000C88A045|nr:MULTISPECIES: DUF2790 domain-containing protein [unclassified Pseudomonas]PMZ87885.1 DUF2790 domain-containing protein [Pseudomonas sp. FW305-42]PNA25901.1 DUF2790 domain-containing protein [Pseudomonas sp. MPR-R1B]PNB27989.1 DUF2790 domain-containing protein [Pseudomonas sp. DP16D-E2]PNB44916.1 DUF2790 domain-containing protein [Pseudomonas sp. FW305-17]PNB63996.1 DUF2790 domain-containing protein [Pseudomonas sp. GW531-E2]